MSIRSRLKQLRKEEPKQVMAQVRAAFHGDKSDFMVGEKVLCRQQPGGKWTIMRYKPDETGGGIPQMDVMRDVPGEVLQF
jgi:hypothetical protein